MIKSIKIVILLLSALLLAWLLPWCYSFVAASPSRSLFTMYSCVTHSFASITFDEQGRVGGRDFRGNTYTEREFDSILPTFYQRQLAAEGRFPAQIEGIDVTSREVERSKIMFRSTPAEINRRTPRLYQLLESMPRRVDFSMPDDVFRITDQGIEFVVMETNQIDARKSAAFTRVMCDKGFAFPARAVAGNPTPRKEYDNGYLLVDHNYGVYHLKQVCGRPFVRRTEIADTLQIRELFVTEFSDRRLLGLLVDKDHRLHALDTEYALHPIPVGAFDPSQDQMTIIGDMFYWTVSIEGLSSERLVAVNARDYSLADEYRPESDARPWELYAAYLFPFELSFTSPLDGYVQPRITAFSLRALVLGMLLAALYAFIRRRSLREEWWSVVGVLLLGLFLFVPLLVFRR